MSSSGATTGDRSNYQARETGSGRPAPAHQQLPSAEEMYQALLRKDPSFEGIFVTAVRTTGIFCRPSCPARKPKRENVEFFATAREALINGYRPCKKCHPLEPAGKTPDYIAKLLAELDEDPSRRMREGDLRARGLEPAKVRDWFKRHHGMTFHAYQRSRRLAAALTRIRSGESISRAALDSGYESLSGFSEAVRQFTGRSPSESSVRQFVYLSLIPTPLGPLLTGTTDEGLCLLEFTDRPMLATQMQRLIKLLDCTFVPGANDMSSRVEDEVRRYFEGTLDSFTVPLIAPGSEFQRRVWDALTSIPFGEVRSYGQLSRMIGSATSVRAVGRANGDNRLAIVIPCHRVIGANGEMVGYGGGLWRKRWLLRHEGATLL